MVEMSEKNKSVLSKLRDKMNGSLNRALVTLAFAGCINAMPAKAQGYYGNRAQTEQVNNYVGTYEGVVIDKRGDDLYLLVNDRNLKTMHDVDGSLLGNMKITSHEAVASYTRAKNKIGSVVGVVVNVSSNSSASGKFKRTRVDVLNGLGSFFYDLDTWKDRLNKLKSDILNVNINRTMGDIQEITIDAAGDGFNNGITRIASTNAEGKQAWAQSYTVDANGYLKPEYDKTATRKTQQGYSISATRGASQQNYSYSTASSGGYNYTSTSSYSAQKKQFPSGYTDLSVYKNGGNNR